MNRRHLLLISSVAGMAVIGLVARFAVPALAIEHHPKTIAGLKAAAVEAATTTPGHRRIRVLIVPGHEPDSGGTVQGRLKERDLAVQLAKRLQGLLDADGRYETMLSRDEQGWNPEIAAYFAEHHDDIDAWQKEAKAEMDARIASGEVPKPVVHIGHNKAPGEVALRLYGITKWADEHDVDVMLHVHFDDDRASSRAVGRRTGFAIFVPTPEYDNAASSRAVAEKVRARLAAFDPIGNLRAEIAAGGIVDDPQLIATGRQNTADAASMLIEYAFIYEARLTAPAVRALAVDDMAYQTALGLEDFFFGAAHPAGATSVLPHAWTKTVRAGSDPADVYALQTALILDGDYPPPGASRNACPRNGRFGPCTRAALAAFQKKYGIAGESGEAGPKTLAELARRP
ncbi:MAG TPA: peptidoglycan-binding protein [Candidatus Baltobacteraceae bacterium]|nr:peptidoglycan-binding protein [Candidatus Baltobacteraceae bacterium]